MLPQPQRRNFADLNRGFGRLASSGRVEDLAGATKSAPAGGGTPVTADAARGFWDRLAATIGRRGSKGLLVAALCIASAPWEQGSGVLTPALSGRLPPFAERRGRKISARPRRELPMCPGPLERVVRPHALLPSGPPPDVYPVRCGTACAGLAPHCHLEPRPLSRRSEWSDKSGIRQRPFLAAA